MSVKTQALAPQRPHQPGCVPHSSLHSVGPRQRTTAAAAAASSSSSMENIENMTARSTSKSRASCCCASGRTPLITPAVAAGRRHSVPCFSHDACTTVRVGKRNSLRSNKIFCNGLYGYENKEFFHGHINTQTILKFPDKLIGKRAPPRELQLQQYHHVRRLYSSRAAVHKKYSVLHRCTSPKL